MKFIQILKANFLNLHKKELFLKKWFWNDYVRSIRSMYVEAKTALIASILVSNLSVVIWNAKRKDVFVFGKMTHNVDFGIFSNRMIWYIFQSHDCQRKDLVQRTPWWKQRIKDRYRCILDGTDSRYDNVQFNANFVWNLLLSFFYQTKFTIKV